MTQYMRINLLDYRNYKPWRVISNNNNNKLKKLAKIKDNLEVS